MISMIKPVSVIYPEGGEPLYEDFAGVRWTASDFAARYGYENVKAFLDSMKEPKYTYKIKEAEIND